MSRRCVIHTDDGRCLGHPAVDDEMYPPICPAHMELLKPLIASQARRLALADGPGAPRRPAAPRKPSLRPDAALNEADARVLAFLASA